MRKNVLCKGMAIVCCLFLFVGTVFAQSTQTVTFFVKADSIWTVPTDLNGTTITVTSVTFDAIGGGGAGGFVYDHNGGEAASGGGGGGAFVTKVLNNPTGTFIIHAGKGGVSLYSNRDAQPVHGEASFVKRQNEDGFVVLAAGGKTVKPYDHGTISTNYYNFYGAMGGQAEDCIPQDGAISGNNGGNGDYGITNTTSGYGGAAGGGDANICGGYTDGLYVDYSLFGTGSTPGTKGAQYGGGGSGAQAYSLRVNSSHDANGGPGHDGVVRVTYYYTVSPVVIVEDTEAEICSGDFTLNLDVTMPEGARSSDITFSFPAVNQAGVNISNLAVNYVNGTFKMSGNITNTTTEAIEFTVLGTATYNNLPTNFNVDFTVYAPMTAGTISESQMVCSGQQISQFESAEAANGGQRGSYLWQISPDGRNWSNIANANNAYYTPTQSGTNYYRRSYVDELCGTVNSNVLIVANINPFDPGTIDVDQEEVCTTEPISLVLTANPSGAIESATYYYYWQKRVNNGAWENIDNAHLVSYNVQLSAEDLAAISSVEYRYAVKWGNCDSVICNGTFKVTVKNNFDYADQFEDVEITLPYGECEVSIADLEVPELDPEAEIALATDQAQTLGVGDHEVLWVVTDECGSVQYSQNVTVNYPECTGFTDVNGNDYEAVRIGCDCWITTNLRTKAGEANFYEENSEYENFGRLYTYAEAMGEANNNDETLLRRDASATSNNVQGICPEGWAIPTLAQYNTMVAAAEGVENVKATEGWLSDHVGTGESGFDAMGAGMYDATATIYKRQLAYAGFWTADENSNATMGTAFEITYGCSDPVTCNQKKENRLSVRCVRVNDEE